MNDSGQRANGDDAARPAEPPQPPPQTDLGTEASVQDAPVPVPSTPEPPPVEVAEPAAPEAPGAQDPPPPVATEVVETDGPDTSAPQEPPSPDGQAESPEPATVEAAQPDGPESPAAQEPPSQEGEGDSPEPATDEVAEPDAPAAQEPAAAEGAPESPDQGKSAGGGGKGRKDSASKPRGGNNRSDRKKSPRRPTPKIPWDEPLVLIRFGRMSQVGVFRHNLDPIPQRDTQVVIRTDRGVELGTLVSGVEADEAPDPGEDCPNGAGADCNGTCLVKSARLATLSADGGSEINFHKLNKVLRLASPQDLNDQVHLDRSEREKRQFCGQQAEELGLKMRLIAVEHLLGGERVVFYFTSESRVDFRELVRRLAGQYRTRIEMRQIGARDEARLVADYERCGQQCCCQAFLGVLQPVSIRMAKVQKATLDPSKISGRCNRLMCCLRYEDPTYEVLRKTLPKKNVWVRTEEVVGKVVSVQILTQLVRIIDVRGAMSVIENAAILERGVEPPDPNAPPPRRVRPRPIAPAPAPIDEPTDGPDAEKASADGAQPAEGDARKRRRRRRRRPKGPEAGGGQPAAAPAAQRESTGSEGSDQPRKKRRRRRRRRPRGEGGPGGGSGGGSAPPSA